MLKFIRIFVFAHLLIADALADEYHYNNLLVGKNAVGLGGAFTAIADDLSALHYNPAGLAKIGSSKMASINTFAWETTDFEAIFSNGEDLERDAFSVVPGFFGVSNKFDTWTFGAALIVLDYSRERSDSSVDFAIPSIGDMPAQQQQQFGSFDIDNSAYQINFSFARELNRHWMLGLSLSTEYRAFETYQASGAVQESQVGDATFTTGFIAGARFSDDNLILGPSLSVLYEKEDFSFGAKIAKNFSLNREHRIVSTINVAGIPPQVPNVVSASRITDQACCKQDYPLNINAGFAYTMSQWQISADVHYFEEVNPTIERLERLGHPITRRLAQVVNYAVGVSYEINAQDSVQIGLFTDNSNSVIDTSIDFQREEQIDLKGVSFAYNTQLFDFPMTFGMYYKYGDGLVRLADLGVVENIVGLPLYPPSDNFNISNAKKRVFVSYFSVNF